MERSFAVWAITGGTRFEEDGPEARDRMHRAALREAHPGPRHLELAGLLTRLSRPRQADPGLPACCAVA